MVLEEPSEPVKPLTATSIASDYFAKELESHSKTSSDTVVIVHDACYGHRYSRLRTSKSMLSMIVERPERIRASVLGMSAAYVRLGSRHSGGEHAPNPILDGTLPRQSPFAIRKSMRAMSLLAPAVVAVHGTDWMDELTMMCVSAGQKLEQGERELERPKQLDAPVSQPEKQKFHEGDLYLCQESLDAFQGALGGVCDAVDAIFDSATNTKRAFVTIRPPGHHCSSDYPSGFCWLNNVHVGIEYAAQTYGLTHAAIFDFDLHHGDGSQEITWARNEKSAGMPKNAPFNKKVAIGYYSMHDINSFPCEGGDRTKVQNASLCIDNAHGQSIWNVHLEPWTTPDDFWRLYETKYLVLLEKARNFLRSHASRIRATPKAIQPKAAIFISAGFDASEHEGAGMQRHAVNVPTEFYARFTRDVVKLAQEEGTAVDGRVISVLEGGYSDRALASGVMSHISGLCQIMNEATGGDSMQAATTMADVESKSRGQFSHVPLYDPQWWHTDLLTALEQYITPPPPPQTKKGRGWLPTFATPTESFAKKVVDPDKLYRSISGTMRPIEELKVDPASLAVNWIVATHELSKLIIPTDRTTTSCKPEDLTVARTKKQRHSSEAPVTTNAANGGRQLRDRRTKASEFFGATSDDESVSIKPEVSAADRRRTIAVLPVSEPAPSDLAARRLSSKEPSVLSDIDLAPPLDGEPPPLPQLPMHTFPEPKPKAAPKSPKGRKPRAPVVKPSVAAHTLPPAALTSSRPASIVGNAGSPRAGSTRTSKKEAPANTKEGTPDIDRLTSGVKRITLKVPSREEHDRRQREREEAERATQEAKKKPRKPAAPRARKSANQSPQLWIEHTAPSMPDKGPIATTPSTSPLADSMTDISSGALHGQSEVASEPSPAAMAVAGERLASAPLDSAVLDATASAQADASSFRSFERPVPPSNKPSVQSMLNPPDIAQETASHGFQLHIPTEPATPASRPAVQSAHVPDTAARQLLSEQQASHWQSAPQTATTRPLQSPPIQFGRTNMPVFSSTGSIPFGPSSSNSNFAASMQVPMLDAEMSHTSGNGVSRSMLGPEDISANASPEHEMKKADIWEIPETSAKNP